MRKSLLSLFVWLACATVMGKQYARSGYNLPLAFSNRAGGTSTALAGSYTINQNLPASARNYQSFTAAIEALRTENTSAPVIFNVAAGQTFVEQPPTIEHDNLHPVTFQKAGIGLNPVVAVGYVTAGFIIEGADHITFDGIDVASVNGGPDNGFYIKNYAYSDGARYIIIKNSTITLSQSRSGSTGIRQNSYTLPGTTDTLASNAHTRYENILIRQAVRGIRIESNSFQGLADYDVEVLNTTVGDGTLRNIGYLSGGYEAYGMSFSNIKGLRIQNNIIQGICGQNNIVYGIDINTASGKTIVSGNRIRDLEFHYPSAGTTYPSCNIAGIYIRQGATAGVPNQVSVYNNEIQSLRHVVTASTPAPTRGGNTVGLFVSAGVYTTNSLRINHNTVEVTGAPWVGYSSAALSVNYSDASNSPLQVVNNLLVNRTTVTAINSSSYHSVVDWSIPRNQSPSGIAPVIWDNNALVVSVSPHVVTGNLFINSLTSHATLSNWKVATGRDIQSRNDDPNFTGRLALLPTNLALDNMGTRISDINTDILGNIRSSVSPDVGAYEFNSVLNNLSPHSAKIGLQTWPVPFDQELYINIPQGLSGPAYLSVTDIVGRTAYTGQLNINNQSIARINTDRFTAGTYILHIIFSNGQRENITVFKRPNR